jgi:sirohydrochlorin ferrochelatase
MDLDQCELVVVGRGSYDSEATDEMQQYAKLLSERVGVGEYRVAFLAMAQPRVREILSESARKVCSTVVLPHLLFHGELLVSLQEAVREWQMRTPEKVWHVAEHLGSAAEVVDAVVARCRETGRSH